MVLLSIHSKSGRMVLLGKRLQFNFNDDLSLRIAASTKPCAQPLSTNQRARFPVGSFCWMRPRRSPAVTHNQHLFTYTNSQAHPHPQDMCKTHEKYQFIIPLKCKILDPSVSLIFKFQIIFCQQKYKIFSNEQPH
jgi:hypothetical protein